MDIRVGRRSRPERILARGRKRGDRGVADERGDGGGGYGWVVENGNPVSSEDL